MKSYFSEGPANGNLSIANYDLPDIILDTISDGIIVTDNTWTILYTNKCSAKILGLLPEKVPGAHLWDFLPPDKNLKFHSLLQKAMIFRHAVKFEECFDSQERWININAYPHRSFLIIHFKDVSAKKRKDRLIKRCADRYKLVLEFTSEAVWELDLKTLHIFWHGNKLGKILGYENPERSIKFWESIVHPDDLEKVKETFFDAMTTGKNYYTCQYRIRRQCGEYIYVRERATILRDSAGEPVRITGVTSDITIEKHNEEALLQAQQSYKTIFENAPLPQWVYDRETFRFINVNAAAIKHYGYSHEEFLQMTLLDIRPEKERVKWIEHLNNNTISKDTWLHQKKNGEKIIVVVSVAPVFYQGNNVYLATLHDITEKCRLQKQLTKEKNEKQQNIIKATINAQEEERAAIGRELHDNINQTLAATALILDVINGSKTLRKDLVGRAKKQLLGVINEIRFLSKGLGSPVLSDLGFYESLNELVEPYVKARKFNVKLICSSEVSTLSSALQLTLYRIIQEQLNNITRHAKASEVFINITLAGNVKLVIKDNGVGFNVENKRKGIGINNILYRAQAYLGNVYIESSPGKGCQLKVEIPV